MSISIVWILAPLLRADLAWARQRERGRTCGDASDVEPGELAAPRPAFEGVAGGVRGEQHVVQGQQRVIAADRFLRKDVEAGAGDFALQQGVDQRRLVDQLGAKMRRMAQELNLTHMEEEV